MSIGGFELIVGVLLGALAAALAVLLLRRAPSEARDLSAMEGRLEQMAVAQSALQGAINKTIGDLARTLGEDLQSGAQKTSESLTQLRERLAMIDAAQANILALSNQVVDLRNVLDNKQARGAFGETQLSDIVQSALPAQSFELQAQIGTKRVDCLLRLPNPPGSIAIDAKFPLEAWRAMREAREQANMTEAQRQFQIAIRNHVKAIADKYIVPGVTADSALMFLPSEAVYAELHSTFPHLVDEASKARVWIVSPTTLMATLTTIRSVLRDVRMREQAHIVRAKVIELGKDVERLDERVKNLQKHFDKANADMRDITISTRKIVDRAAQIGELEGDAGAPASAIAAGIGNETRLN